MHKLTFAALLIVAPLFAGCAGLGRPADPKAWELQLSAFSQDLGDLAQIAESDSLKEALEKTQAVLARASQAVARYNAVGGDDISRVELLVALQAALDELDAVLRGSDVDGDVRTGVAAVKIALRHMMAGLGG